MLLWMCVCMCLWRSMQPWAGHAHTKTRTHAPPHTRYNAGCSTRHGSCRKELNGVNQQKSKAIIQNDSHGDVKDRRKIIVHLYLHYKINEIEYSSKKSMQ